MYEAEQGKYSAHIYVQLNRSDIVMYFIDSFNFLCKSTLPH